MKNILYQSHFLLLRTILFAFFSVPSFAMTIEADKEGLVIVKVMDIETKEPLNGAIVSIVVGQEKSNTSYKPLCKTEVAGTCSLSLMPGLYYVLAEQDGYIPTENSVYVKKRKKVEIIFLVKIKSKEEIVRKIKEAKSERNLSKAKSYLKKLYSWGKTTNNEKILEEYKQLREIILPSFYDPYEEDFFIGLAGGFIPSESGISGGIGIAINLALHDLLYITLEPRLMRRLSFGAPPDSEPDKLFDQLLKTQLDYLEISMTGKLYSPVSEIPVYLIMGGNVGHLIGSRQSINETEIEIMNKVKSLNFGLDVGAGYITGDAWLLEGHFDIGLTTIVVNTQSFKHRTLRIALGFIF